MPERWGGSGGESVTRVRDALQIACVAWALRADSAAPCEGGTPPCGCPSMHLHGGTPFPLLQPSKTTARGGTKTASGFPRTKEGSHTISAQAFHAGVCPCAQVPCVVARFQNNAGATLAAPMVTQAPPANALTPSRCACGVLSSKTW